MKIKRVFSILISFTFLVTILFTLTTCKKKSEDPPPTNNEFVIAPKAKFIVDNDWQSMVKNIDSANYTVTFDKGLLSKYSLAKGDLMVSSVGNGLLRKIESITQTGNDVKFQTSQATLVDLIQQGDIDFKESLSLSKIKSIRCYYPGISLDTVSIKSADGTLFNWDINTEIYPQIRLQGNFQYTSDFILQIQISVLQGLKKVKFGFEGTEEFNLALIAGKQFTLNKQITLATVYFVPILIPLPVPPFAIVIAPVLDVKLGLDGYANANISTTLAQNFTIETGIQYLKDGGWSSYMNYDKSFNYTPPQLNVNAGAEAYLKPELRMLIYNLIGPYVNGKGYGKIEADLTQNPWWKMYYGLKMSAGVKATILSVLLFDFSVGDLLSWEQQVGQSTSGTAPTVTTASITNITETTATSGGNVTVQGSSSVSARGVCWSTTQNPTTSDAKTADGSGTGSFTSNVTGLTANTPYYVRAYATNSEGTSYGSQVSFTTTGGSAGEPCPGMPTITDSRDGQVYPTVQIGSQCWLQKNMNYSTGNSWCYDNNSSNCNTYGRLYDWQTAFGACPSGWHLPSDAEWTALTDFLGGESVAGGKMKEAGIVHWASPNTGATNSSGFTALPGGYRYNSGGFDNLTYYTNFWLSTELSSTTAWARSLVYNNEDVYRYNNLKPNGFSARCIQDQGSGTVPTVSTSSITDITETSATGGGNVTAQGSSSVTARGVCWSTSQNPTTSDAKTTDGIGTGSFTSNITGLNANTPYYVRAYATNSAGTSYGSQVSFTTTGGSAGEPCPGIPTITDSRDGQVYPTVQIGSQCWLQKNMNYSTGNSWCYDNNTSNCNTYGRLYDWQTALGACPSGWHLPSDAEWTALTDFLGGESIAGGKMKEAGTAHWASPNTGATNSSGFTALPGGLRFSFGNFDNLTINAQFWSSTDFSSYAWYRCLLYNYEGVDRFNLSKTVGFSARCVKDN